MSKLFIFAIGGTGSRVLRSLTMLLAAGVKVEFDEVVPIIIDPDGSNADLTRTVALLNKYNEVRKHLQFTADSESRFFRTEISRVLPNYTLHIDDTDDKTFQQFIGYSSMSAANKAFTKMLFSDKNLASSMEVGFKGNPNIGSVVLNQIAHSQDFESFANAFNDGDKIFIISSIFGGTGASGFPLLIKTLREGSHFPNFDLINRARIGAVTVLPYFKLKRSEESEIDSSTFISKTKSALAYYEHNIAKNGLVDALYYLGDNGETTYDNNEGGSAQQNAAHLIEFLSATAMVHFGDFDCDSPQNLELGIKEGTDGVTFSTFYQGMHTMLYAPLVQFTLMSNALSHQYDFFSSSKFNANKGNFTDLYTGNFFRSLRDFIRCYHEWLGELKSNKRSLDLFDLQCGNNAFDLVTGVKPKRVFSLKSGYDLMSDRLGASLSSCKSTGKESKFLEMFYLGTQKLVKEKLTN